MTFSLIARCAETGQFGAVITTSNAAVGSRCCHLKAGVGGVLTQHRTDPRLGPRGLELLESGCTADETIAALAASSTDIGWRQLACVDAAGRTAAFHGDRIYSIHGDAHGNGCVAIGNIIDHPDVPPSMIKAFEADSARPLGERLLAAIEAGEAAGGETGTVHSAQVIAVGEDSFPVFDLRVDWSDTPLSDLRSLYNRYGPERDGFRVRVLEPDTVPVDPKLLADATARKKALGLD